MKSSGEFRGHVPNSKVEVKSGANVVLKCEYDGLGRRTKKHINTSSPLDETYDAFQHFFYNAAWQILETRLSESENTGPETLQPEYQYVWSLRYIDAAVLRDKNTDEDDLCDDQRLYYTNDANMNVTALVGDDGTVLERYLYDPYGKVTVLDPDYSADADNKSDYDNSILYCGYYFDNETGLYHVRRRPYHPPLGRMLTRDPIGYADAMGLYEYAGSHPTDLTDFAGLSIVAVVGQDILTREKFTKGGRTPVDLQAYYANAVEAGIVELCKCVKFLGSPRYQRAGNLFSMTPVTKNGRTTPYDPDNSAEKKAFCDCYKNNRPGCNLVMPVLTSKTALTLTWSRKFVRGNAVLSFNPPIVQFNPEVKTGQEGKERPIGVGMAHELGHLYAGQSGDHVLDQYRATVVENQVRSQLKLPLISRPAETMGMTMEELKQKYGNYPGVGEDDKCFCND